MTAILLAMMLGLAPDRPTITVSAAISLRDPLVQIAQAYEREFNVHVELNFGASGQLMSQIRQGAPVDLFIAASHHQVDELIEQKRLDPATRTEVARNRLVLIAPAGARVAPKSFEDLARAEFARIAVGEPRTVPAGEYAMQVLRSLKIGPAVNSRLIYGTNVRQVLAYVEQGEVSAGIVYLTDAKISGEKVRIMATADEAWHEPIIYPAAIVAASSKQEPAGEFIKYIRLEKSQQILGNYGFLAPAPPP